MYFFEDCCILLQWADEREGKDAWKFLRWATFSEEILYIFLLSPGYSVLVLCNWLVFCYLIEIPPSTLKESRGKRSLENLKSDPEVTKINGLLFNPKTKIADGCNGAEVFAGLFGKRHVAVKRVVKHVANKEMEMAKFLCSEKLLGKHLLKPFKGLEDSTFAYFVSPLCEYNLKDLIEDKEFPETKPDWAVETGNLQGVIAGTSGTLLTQNFAQRFEASKHLVW